VSRHTVELVSQSELIARAGFLAMPGRRRLLGICGAPGAGKSTLAEAISDALGVRATLVGMDGFHLAQRELRRLGRLERKGAPDTFDAAGYVDLLIRLRDNGIASTVAETVYAPEFRREIEEPIACAIPVFPETPLVITEGNYLLLREHPWDRVRGLLDEVWFLAPDERKRKQRLVRRHRNYGRSARQAEARALGSDQANAELVAATADLADHVFRITDASAGAPNDQPAPPR
jgi:pantothenate kinase